jgi:hypothetical protein
MEPDFLHNHPQVKELLQIIADEMGIDPYLVEKDYWIMHVLYGLNVQGYDFELKGGTSLSKGYGIIDRFSEDIDIHIHPGPVPKVYTGKNHTKSQHSDSRRNFYDNLAKEISVSGASSIIRDVAYDDQQYYRSGGIRILYPALFPAVEGGKEGILLEAGFDLVAPNEPLMITSWAYERAFQTLGDQLIDNRAMDIKCYHPGYTFVEKLQTIATKYRQEQESGKEKQNFMRQYYDVSRLLSHPMVKEFIGTQAYLDHKKARFPAADLQVPIAKNEAFLLSDPKTRERFRTRYESTRALYYKGQPPFQDVIEMIHQYLPSL